MTWGTQMSQEWPPPADAAPAAGSSTDFRADAAPAAGGYTSADAAPAAGNRPVKPPRYHDWPTNLEHGINIKYYVIRSTNDINPFINHDGRIDFDKYNDCIPTPRLLSFLKSEAHL